MVLVSSADDQWYLRMLHVKHPCAPQTAVQSLRSAVGIALSLHPEHGANMTGLLDGAGLVAVSVVQRPRSRGDKNFFYNVISDRQILRTQFPGHEVIQFLAVRADVLREIGDYGGLDTFFEGMQYAEIGVFSCANWGTSYYPMKPNSFLYGVGTPTESTHDYDQVRYSTNLLGERALAAIGRVEYA